MILHISNDFNATKVHKELYKKLDQEGIDQLIFIPLRHKDQIGKNHFDFISDNSKFVYSSKINIIHRVFFNFKIHKLYYSLLKNVDIKSISLSHATTLFSDGAIAYKLYKKFSIPYIVAVRSTDINFYFNKRKELIPLAIEILCKAKKIIFVSESNKKNFLAKDQILKILDLINEKIEVISNGVDDFWLDNISPYLYKPTNYDFLFIGRFEESKNVKNLVVSLEKFRLKTGNEIKLHIVGGTGSKRQETLEFISNYDWIIFHGQINDKNQILDIFNQVNYFTLISHTETFGLVFIEALSQGKPILYTKNQGIDGLINFSIGEKVNSRNIDEIVESIDIMTKTNYHEINKINFKQFYWSNIAKKYINIYNSI